MGNCMKKEEAYIGHDSGLEIKEYSKNGSTSKFLI
jgi:hypothetical protein